VEEKDELRSKWLWAAVLVTLPFHVALFGIIIAKLVIHKQRAQAKAKLGWDANCPLIRFNCVYDRVTVTIARDEKYILKRYGVHKFCGMCGYKHLHFIALLAQVTR
jgi:hypothetical protein